MNKYEGKADDADAHPYRENEAPECHSRTPSKIAVCARCRFKSEVIETSNARYAYSDKFCLADYGGVHPLLGTKSPVWLDKDPDNEERWKPLKHAVLCEERNPSGRCDRFESNSIWAKINRFFKKLI